MASITDCVVEGLKYPFNDVKRLLGFGAVFALINLISLTISVNSFNVFRTIVHTTQNTNDTLSTLHFSQLPIGDIKFIIALSILSFIISVFIMGYQYNVVRFSIDRKETLPSLIDVLNIFINGIKYFIVTLAYNIIPAIILMLGLVLLSDSSVMLIIALISMILFIIAFFFIIMALNNMIAYDSLKKAFDYKEIIENISNLGWGKYIGIILFTLIVYTIIMAAAGFILSFLSVMFAAVINNQAFVVSAFITIVEGLFITSYCTIFCNRVFGSVYRESLK